LNRNQVLALQKICFKWTEQGKDPILPSISQQTNKKGDKLYREFEQYLERSAMTASCQAVLHPTKIKILRNPLPTSHNSQYRQLNTNYNDNNNNKKLQ